MEAEKNEEIKRGDNSLSFWNIMNTFQFVVFVAFVGYFCLPGTVNSVQAIAVWFDWYCVFLRNIFLIFLLVIGLVALIYVLYSRNTGVKQLDLYDQYIAAAPTVVVRPSPDVYSNGAEVGDYNCGYHTSSNYNNDIVPEFQAVNTVETVRESTSCYDRVAVEVSSKKSYRKTKTEKKTRTVEYRRMQSEKVMKTAQWRSQTMNDLNNEEFQMTVETYIMEKKRMFRQHYDVADQWQRGHAPDQWHNGVVPQWHNGVVDQWHNGVPQLQNGFADQWQHGHAPDQWQNGVPQWQNGVPQLQNGVADQWQNGVPQLENGVADQWQNGLVQWQGLPRDDGAGRRRHRSRRGSGSTGPGSYLAISN